MFITLQTAFRIYKIRNAGPYIYFLLIGPEKTPIKKIATACAVCLHTNVRRHIVRLPLLIVNEFLRFISEKVKHSRVFKCQYKYSNFFRTAKQNHAFRLLPLQR